MIENLDILYSVTGQSLTFNTPEGVPSLITSTVFENSQGDDSTAELATTGSAQASTVATIFSGNAGVSSQFNRVLAVDSTANFQRLGRYLATNAMGETERVEVSAIDAGVGLTARHRLKNDYVSGDTVVATEITHALDTAWVSEKNNISPPKPGPRYRWRLEYTANGKIYVHSIYFDLVRESGNTTVTAIDIDRTYPWLDFLSILPDAHSEDRGAGIIADAYRQVKLAMGYDGKADEAARNREVVEDLVIHKAAFIAAGKDLDAIAIIQANYDQAFNNLIRAGQLQFDADGSGAAQPSPKSPGWRR